MTTKWIFEVKRQFSVLYVDFFLEALRANICYQVYDVDYSCQNYKIVRGREYWRSRDLMKLDAVYEKKYEKAPGFLEEQAAITKAACRTLAQKVHGLSAVDWQAARLEALASEWRVFCKRVLPVAAAVNARPVEFIEARLIPVVNNMCNRSKWIRSREALVAIINSVSSPLSYRDEPVDLLRIGSLIQDDLQYTALFDGHITPEKIVIELPESLRQVLVAYQEKYSWMNHPYAALRDDYKLVDYVYRLQHLVNRSSCSQEVLRVQQLRATDRNKLKEIVGWANSKEVRIIRAANEYAFLRTRTVEVLDHAFVEVRKTLLGEIRRRLKLSDSQVVSMTAQDIYDSIINLCPSVSTEELDRRAREYVYVFEEGHTRILSDETEMTKYEEKTDEESGCNPKASFVSGMVASKGFVTGPAKILKSPSDSGKVNVGDIIITSMTTPEYIAAMEKAAAFVTDEGGITCHAAITSREFGVPCVVGTQVASDTFKDNDTIRVDALNGNVWKI